jgi:hypothetical protein
MDVFCQNINPLPKHQDTQEYLIHVFRDVAEESEQVVGVIFGNIIKLINFNWNCFL